MFESKLGTTLRLAAVAIALTATGTALADDSSMSPLTGDSYAYFYGLEFNPGGFNVARAPTAATSIAQPAPAATSTAQPAPAAAATQPATEHLRDERPTMLAQKSVTGPSKIFDDNTGA